MPQSVERHHISYVDSKEKSTKIDSFGWGSFVIIVVVQICTTGCTVDLDYTCNNIGCNKTSAVAKSFSGTVFFSSLNNCTRTSALTKAY